ncbi:phosphoribosylanthranilate isomerase [Muriicola marianensis]|uniref:N-(5'-phosphoribosyl)anthranilate isomerase n=1 Tax=Muriicola marianensis TaxID=1324801 RepID=A0ABQ1QUC9_9FLAO|nr:phosphoribosylanthranilate isomerase [Muriicola marianensis]GGD44195.1 N-(5'-phosphoribosyl)anthranilate isomerase [Muriicola marianensis]
MKIKVCGMKYPENMEQVSQLRPDYMGFIFWEPSSRFFTGSIPEIPETIDKVGVFVDASIPYILEKVKDLNLQLVQLHGQESPDFCTSLRRELENLIGPDRKIEIVKAIAVGQSFSFGDLNPFEGRVDYFLFDSKGPLPGGNGFAFDWKLLEGYDLDTPFFLSGGIGLAEVEILKGFMGTSLVKKCHAIDVNSAFELEPGLKDPRKLQSFIKEIRL